MRKRQAKKICKNLMRYSPSQQRKAIYKIYAPQIRGFLLLANRVKNIWRTFIKGMNVIKNLKKALEL